MIFSTNWWISDDFLITVHPEAQESINLSEIQRINWYICTLPYISILTCLSFLKLSKKNIFPQNFFLVTALLKYILSAWLQPIELSSQFLCDLLLNFVLLDYVKLLMFLLDRYVPQNIIFHLKLLFRSFFLFSYVYCVQFKFSQWYSIEKKISLNTKKKYFFSSRKNLLFFEHFSLLIFSLLWKNVFVWNRNKTAFLLNF